MSACLDTETVTFPDMNNMKANQALPPWPPGSPTTASA